MPVSKSTAEQIYAMVNEQGMTIEEVAEIRGVTRKTIVDYLSKYERYNRLIEEDDKLEYEPVENSVWDKLVEDEPVLHETHIDNDDVFPILVIGDTHEPFSHPNYLQFCKDQYEKYGCKSVVHVGDLADNHYPARHDTETDAMGGTQEYIQTKKKIKRWVDTFPKLHYCLGNHDRIPERQAHKMGLSSGFLKSFSEQWDLPSTWDVATEHIIGGVLFTHGINCGGKDGAYNLAVQERMSAVIGHQHSYLGVKYNANPRSIVFGMNVGCGIDVNAYAMRYGKYFKLKPTMGCGVVSSPTEAYTIPMTQKYFRD